MKITLPSFLSKSDWLHVGVGLMIFTTFWAFISMYVALIIVILVAFAKEINDHTGTIKWLLTNPSNQTTGFNPKDWILTTGLPILIVVIHLVINE